MTQPPHEYYNYLPDTMKGALGNDVDAKCVDITTYASLFSSALTESQGLSKCRLTCTSGN